MNYNFDAPIPGQSLTALPGSAPYEMPPQFTNPNDAVEYLWGKLTQPKRARDLLLLLKKGMPVEGVVNTVLFQGIMDGKWTVDVALLIYQVVYWQVETLAKAKGVKYKDFNPNQQEEEFLDSFIDLLDEKPEDPMAAETPDTLFKGLLK